MNILESMPSSIDILKIVIMVLALLVSIIGHEIMHGLVAYHYGDNTAKSMGRLSINPLKHIDPVGSILVPAILYITNVPFLFGWAKPVPIDMHHIIQNRGYGGAIGVAIAGVCYNFALAILASLILFSGIYGNPQESFISLVCMFFLVSLIQYNVVLCVFNLWPIPPLDGSQVVLFAALKCKLIGLARFLNSIAPYGMFILIAILFIPPLSSILFYPARILFSFLIS